MFTTESNIYDKDQTLNTEFMSNKLLATFTQKNEVDGLTNYLSTSYNILYSKIFVLFVKSTNEYVLTYNIESGNISNIPENTILVHRKKDWNVLFSVNGLNELVKTLNNGVMDDRFPIDWKQYKNSILLTQNGEFKQLNTNLNKIVNI